MALLSWLYQLSGPSKGWKKNKLGLEQWEIGSIYFSRCLELPANSSSYDAPGSNVTICQGPVNRCMSLSTLLLLESEWVVRCANTISPQKKRKGSGAENWPTPIASVVAIWQGAPQYSGRMRGKLQVDLSLTQWHHEQSIILCAFRWRNWLKKRTRSKWLPCSGICPCQA